MQPPMPSYVQSYIESYIESNLHTILHPSLPHLPRAHPSPCMRCAARATLGESNEWTSHSCLSTSLTAKVKYWMVK